MIGIASDHAGVELKKNLVDYLVSHDYTIKDFGTDSLESCDYPDFIHPLVQEMDGGGINLGIAVCYTANGMAITANKYPYIRAAICWSKKTAELARAHNNANVIAIPAGFLSTSEAIEILQIFLSTPFDESATRHVRRVQKMNP